MTNPPFTSAIPSPPITSTAFPTWKRHLDLLLVFLTLPLWLPLMILIALFIKLVSKGPVFFQQCRVGLDEKFFFILKFRSMRQNAETNTHSAHLHDLMQTNQPMTKLDASGDPRLIPGGRLLRLSGLDELPQLINVLRGEMSLVGPRPCTPEEFYRYQEKDKARFRFPPGLTGWWQVNGKNRTTFRQMLDLDLEYGRLMSVPFDLLIILRTIPSLLLDYWLKDRPSQASPLKPKTSPTSDDHSK